MEPKVLALIVGAAVVNVFLGNPVDFPDAIDITDLEPRPGPGWVYIDGEFAPPAPAEDAADRRVTRLAFRSRFTQDELVGIEIAALDDPAAAMEARQQAAALRVMQRNVDTATFVDLERDEVRGGVAQLEALGLIGVGRAAEILDTPVDPGERP